MIFLTIGAQSSKAGDMQVKNNDCVGFNNDWIYFENGKITSLKQGLKLIYNLLDNNYYVVI